MINNKSELNKTGNSGLEQKLYKISLEHLVVPESKEVLKETNTHTHTIPHHTTPTMMGVC